MKPANPIPHPKLRVVETSGQQAVAIDAVVRWIAGAGPAPASTTVREWLRGQVPEPRVEPAVPDSVERKDAACTRKLCMRALSIYQQPINQQYRFGPTHRSPSSEPYEQVVQLHQPAA